jgi:hypothetical protein
MDSDLLGHQLFPLSGMRALWADMRRRRPNAEHAVGALAVGHEEYVRSLSEQAQLILLALILCLSEDLDLAEDTVVTGLYMQLSAANVDDRLTYLSGELGA